MRILTPNMEQLNTAVGVAFMRKVGAPQWRLVSGATARVFGESSLDRMTAWVTEMQRGGQPVLALLPMLEDGHWWLAARLAAPFQGSIVSRAGAAGRS